MTAFTKEILANAIIAVRAMDLHQCEQLSDEIHANQPQLWVELLSSPPQRPAVQWLLD